MRKIGDRVGAILGSNDDGSIDFLGYGVYDGQHVPHDAVGQLADGLKKYNLENPKIILDDGSHVYGCECWWGSEGEVKKVLKDKKINKVDINEIRKKYNEKN